MAISTHCSQSWASIASRNALEPLALVRSPIDRKEVSCRNGTDWYSDAAAASWTGLARRDRRPPTRSTTRRRCSGVVPQQPPTSDSP